MKILTYAGGREVVASGTLILAGGDVVGTVVIEDISYHFVIAHSPEPPTMSPSNPDMKSLRFMVAGSFNSPCQWHFADVGTIDGRTISMAVVVTWFSAIQDRPVSAKLEYTFTASAGAVADALAGLLK